MGYTLIRWSNLNAIISIKASCLLAAVLFGLTPAAAEIFKWTDENGKVHFGDRPPGEREVEKID
jgi:hypothetical protein